jgi:hypothetical protein
VWYIIHNTSYTTHRTPYSHPTHTPYTILQVVRLSVETDKNGSVTAANLELVRYIGSSSEGVGYPRGVAMR